MCLHSAPIFFHNPKLRKIKLRKSAVSKIKYHPWIKIPLMAKMPPLEICHPVRVLALLVPGGGPGLEDEWCFA
jgi:hypothetical protein